MSTPIGSGAEQYATMLKEYAARGLVVNERLSFRETGGGFGAIASAPVKAGETLLSIPYSSILTETCASKRSLAKRARELVHDTSGIESRTWLCLELLDLRFRPGSRPGDDPHPDTTMQWKAYATSLPEAFDDPLHWPEELLSDALHGTNLFAAVGTLRAQHLGQWEALFPALSVADPVWFPAAVFSFGRFLWASSAFRSRGFPHYLSVPPGVPPSALEEGDFEAVGCLLPALDILNHSPSAKVRWERRVDCVCFITEEDIPQGSEVQNNYGPKGNEELLLSFGFAIDENPHDSVALTLTAPNLERDSLAVLRHRVARMASLVRPRFFLTDACPLPPSLLGAFLVAGASEENLSALLRLGLTTIATDITTTAAVVSELDETALLLKQARKADDPLVDFDNAWVSGPLFRCITDAAKTLLDRSLDAMCPFSFASTLSSVFACLPLLEHKLSLLDQCTDRVDAHTATRVGRVGHRLECARRYLAGQRRILRASLERASTVAAWLHDTSPRWVGSPCPSPPPSSEWQVSGSLALPLVAEDRVSLALSLCAQEHRPIPQAAEAGRKRPRPDHSEPHSSKRGSDFKTSAQALIERMVSDAGEPAFVRVMLSPETALEIEPAETALVGALLDWREEVEHIYDDLCEAGTLPAAGTTLSAWVRAIARVDVCSLPLEGGGFVLDTSDAPLVCLLESPSPSVRAVRTPEGGVNLEGIPSAESACSRPHRADTALDVVQAWFHVADPRLHFTVRVVSSSRGLQLAALSECTFPVLVTTASDGSVTSVECDDLLRAVFVLHDQEALPESAVDVCGSPLVGPSWAEQSRPGCRLMMQSPRSSIPAEAVSLLQQARSDERGERELRDVFRTVVAAS
jgi:hypothetical protein